MNKTLNIIVIIIVVLIIIFLVCALLGPQGFKMERSVDIKASKNTIYKNLSDYRRWPLWSPWYELDTNCAYDYYGTQGQVGAGYKWKGNAKAGEGDMVQNSSLTCQLTFIKPFPSKAIATFKLEDGADGTTKVTWGFSQSYSFMQRPMMLLFNMEKMLGGDYEKGLARLKTLSESDAAGSAQALQVKEIDWIGRTYVAARAEVNIKDLSEVFMDKMPKTFSYMQDNKMQMDGAATGIYFSWDTVAGKTDMAVGIPVKDASKASGLYTSITIPTSRALMVDYYGAYSNMKVAHDAIHKYAQDKGLKLKSPNIEEYVTDPGEEKDPNKILTKVYYLIEG